MAASVPTHVAMRRHPHAIRAGAAVAFRANPSKHAAPRRVAHNWYAACWTWHIESPVVAMPIVATNEPQTPVQRGPAVPSSESIQKAQALREAIRRKLLSRPAPPVNPYWSVGAD